MMNLLSCNREVWSVMLSLRNLVQSSVDYAGLFPPAALPLDVVARNYASYLASSNNLMLARLVIPTSRLDELESAAVDLVKSNPWQISALVPPWTANDQLCVEACRAINAFNGRQEKFKVDSIETKVLTAESVAPIVTSLPDAVVAFLEVAFGDGQAAMLAEIAGKKKPNVFAKARTGSVVAEQIPTVSAVASFIAECSRLGLGFKATAGLHHPLRAEYRLTYEDNPPCGVMHGFVNVFVASVVAFEHQVSETLIQEVLTESSADAFSFDEEKLSWRDLSVNAERIAHWRQAGILSFGSCSFDEPTTELASLFQIDS